MEQEMKVLHTGLLKEAGTEVAEIPDEGQLLWPPLPQESRILSFEITTVPNTEVTFNQPKYHHEEVNKASVEALVGQRLPDRILNAEMLTSGVNTGWILHYDTKKTMNKPVEKTINRLVIGEFEPKVTGYPGTMYSGRRTKQQISFAQKWRYMPLDMARSFVEDDLYYGHCGYMEMVCEAASALSMTKPPSYFLLGPPTNPITLNILQDAEGSEGNPFSDGRDYAQDNFTDHMQQILQLYWPRGPWTDRDRAIL
jgi:hypothetical protein